MDWKALKEHGFAENLIREVKYILMKAEDQTIDIEKISDKNKENLERVKNLMEFLIEKGEVERIIQYRCPICNDVLSEKEAQMEACPYCERFYAEFDEIEKEEIYKRIGPSRRDVKWIIFIHGMNTRGEWQENLSFHLSNIFFKSIPIYIYKYGMVRLSSVMRCRQRRLIDTFYKKYKEAQRAVAVEKPGSKPDIIAHSFGTWLVGHMLTKYKDVKVGRIILIGSILRPDFDWEKLIKREQVEAVFNHAGTKDFPVKI
jgi:hypothetical protein